jgi:hypothetical protein
VAAFRYLTTVTFGNPSDSCNRTDALSIFRCASFLGHHAKSSTAELVIESAA